MGINRSQIKSKLKLLGQPASKQVLVDTIVVIAERMDTIPETVEEYSRVAEEVHLSLVQKYTKQLQGKPKEGRVKYYDLEKAIEDAKEGKY